jgi:hypothetical protein
VPRYIKTHPNVEAALAVEFKKEKELTDDLNQLYQWRLETEQKQKKNQQLREVLAREFKKLIAAKKGNGDQTPSQKKRKRNEDGQPAGIIIPNHDTNISWTNSLGSGRPPLTEEQKSTNKKMKELHAKMKETDSAIDNDGAYLYRLNSRIKEIEIAFMRLESRKKGVCIKNRNEVSTKEIRQDFEAAVKQMGRMGDSKPLQVFCVSSWAFVHLTKGAGPFPGFRKGPDTGIPALQTWLVETTLGTRNHNAVSFLESVVSLELSMVPWLADTSDEYKMPVSQRDVVEDMFDNNFQDLVKVY